MGLYISQRDGAVVGDVVDLASAWSLSLYALMCEITELSSELYLVDFDGT